VVILIWWKLLGRQLARPREAASFRATGPHSIDEDIVQDREQPNPKVVPGAKARALLVSTNERVMNQILGIGVAAREHSCIAAQSGQFAEHV
jgi:hypothetical protein